MDEMQVTAADSAARDTQNYVAVFENPWFRTLDLRESNVRYLMRLANLLCKLKSTYGLERRSCPYSIKPSSSPWDRHRARHQEQGW